MHMLIIISETKQLGYLTEFLTSEEFGERKPLLDLDNSSLLVITLEFSFENVIWN